MKRLISINISIFLIVVGAVFLAYNIFYPIEYKPLILKYCKAYNLNTSVVSALINAESGFDKDTISGVGAVGLMQVMPKTAEYIVELYNFNTNYILTNSEDNIKIGCAYLHYLSIKFSNFQTVLAAYNCGETVVRSWLNDPNCSVDKITLKHIPFIETRNYINKINNTKIIYFYKF